MVNIVIDKREVSVNENETILSAAKIAGIDIPTLCYLKEVNEVAACRICVVEVEGLGKLVPACTTVVEDGMVIYTDSERVREARKTTLELILSKHDSHCNTCRRDRNCKLQDLVKKYNLPECVYTKKVSDKITDTSFPLIRQSSKCIGCLRCINVCEKRQALGIWDLVGTGKSAKIDTRSGKKLKEDDCSLCGQCITHCPVGALYEREDIDKVYKAITNPDIITMVQIAPAVRVAFGESFDDKYKMTVGKMVTCARNLGFNYVFDTDFSADLTIMEEATELVDRVSNGGVLPMFTSCCPGWVRYLKARYPEFIPNLSTAKSPQQMFGAISKTYFAKVLGVSPDKLFCVSIMPCVAKKAECDMDSMSNYDYGKDVDASITTREFEKMVLSQNFDLSKIKESDFDKPLGFGTGAGVIFGTTGGVMEAALRSGYYFVTGKNPSPDFIRDKRVDNGITEFNVELGGVKLSIAVASGLKNAETLLEKVKAGYAKYDFIEIMACPSGCAGGGGQPIYGDGELGVLRGKGLYALDDKSSIRFSHENPYIKSVYDEYLGKPNSHLAHELLHVDHNK